MYFNRKDYSNELLLDLYKALIKPRLFEEKMLLLLRQGKISKWFSGIGQEAVAVGAAMALEEDEYILPLHRNLGVFTSRKLSMAKLFAQFQGKKSGFTKGRDRSFHFTSQEHHIVGMISHLGPQLAVADGLALASVLKKEQRVTLVFTGEGGASEGDFHEALNIAAVWNLPVIFLVENNGYGLSTPSIEQYRCKSFIEKGPAYGIDALQIDGNNILEVYDTIRQTARGMRNHPRPVLIEAMTFRMRGHEEASGTKYVPEELFDKWAKKDPVENFERYIVKEHIITESKIKTLKESIRKEIELAVQASEDEEMPVGHMWQEIGDVYAPFQQQVKLPSLEALSSKRYVDAISDALRQSMEEYPELILMGQDIAEYGGVFKVTEGFVELFGKERVRNTPLCESGVIGAAYGYSLHGGKSVVEMQFGDFVTMGFNQIVNNLAKSHYRTGQNADVVVRMPAGAGTSAGPFHSQTNEAWFFHTPGLKIVYPSSVYDAKGLLNAAIEDPNPVMYFEHKALYRTLTDDIPDDYYTIKIGEANIVREGNDLTVVTYGMGVHWVMKVQEQHPELDIEVIDLRTILPWDKHKVFESVKKTGRVLVASEDSLTGSICAEIAAWIAENCFSYLDAPVMREGSLDTPVPFSPELEKNYLPEARIREKILYLASF